MTPEPSTDIPIENTENDASVINSSSGGTNTTSTSAVKSSQPPTSSLSKSKSYKQKDEKPKGLISSLRRSSSVQKMTEKYGSLKSKAVSKGKGIIQMSKKKVKKADALVASPVAVKDIEAESKGRGVTPTNEEGSSKYEEETCFNVEFDTLPPGMEAPVDSYSTAGVSVKEDAITIVLLLLDGRRFELLQLEMNPSTATVQDILNQIPLESTDKALRVQTYNGVCDRDGVELDQKKLVGDYYPLDRSVYYVAMAIPAVMSREEVVKFSKPIFSDTNISTMFKGSKKEGASTQPVSKPEEEAPVVTEEAPAVPEEAPAVPEETDTKESVSESNKNTDATEEISKVADTKVEVKETTQQPVIKKKDIISPKATTASFKKEIKKMFSNPKEKKSEAKKEKKPEVKQEEKAVDKIDEKKLDSDKQDSKQEVKVVASESLKQTAKPSSPSKLGTSLKFSILVVLLSMIPIMIMLMHERLYSPLAPNQELKVGQWRSSCGLFRFLPEPYKHCDSILLRMDEGGSLTLVDENTNTVYWEMRSFADCEEGCSAEVTEAGIVEIGGEPAALVSSSKISVPEFSAPWPFENDEVVPSWPFSTAVNMTPKRKRKKNKSTK